MMCQNVFIPLFVRQTVNDVEKNPDPMILNIISLIQQPLNILTTN